MKKYFSLLLVLLLIFNLFIPIQLVAASDIHNPEISEVTDSTDLNLESNENLTDTDETLKESESNIEDVKEPEEDADLKEKENSNQQEEKRNNESETNKQFINEDSNTSDNSVEESISPEEDNTNGEDVDQGEDAENNLTKSSTFSIMEEVATSRLGHLRGVAKIYPNLHNQESYKNAKDGYTNAVYYVKRKALLRGETFYLISTKPSSTQGTIGWVKENELDSRPHKTIDSKSKTLYIKGTGSAYSKAWGGSKDIVYSDMSAYKNQAFKVNLTESVGNNTWYRGVLNGKTVWLHSSYLTDKVESNVSRLGHLRGVAKIYPNLHNQESYKNAKDGYTNAVYYVKRKALLRGETFYLISTKPSSTQGTIGWVKENELDSRPHKTIDSKSKTFYIKGTGSAYSKAWGGSKDIVYSNMSAYKNQAFKVNLTESVGNNTWYRGVLNGKTVWLHSSYLTDKVESNVSRLGHLRGGAKIYPNLHNQKSYKNAKDGYTNAVYYIKRKAVLGGETFYLISTKPSSTQGTIGWVKESELDSRSHKTIDSKSKTLYIKGTGSAYSKAWGGSKNFVFSNLKKHSGAEFRINLTEKVGNNTWYRGKISGKTAWIHESHLTNSLNLTLNEAVNIQMKASPQTDKKYRTYVSKAYINSKNEVTADVLNVRGGPSANYWVVGQLTKGSKVNVIRETNGWYEIDFAKSRQWVNASPSDVLYYLDPKNFINDSKQQFQFLDLSRLSGASASLLDNYLKGKGTLSGQGKAFIEAGRIHGINEVYLISHATLETGHGTSKLASGVKYNGVTVYNMYGVGAYDSCPVECGAKTAYEQGWTSPAKAIIGGAKFIGERYIHQGQNTLYKMRWNPVAMSLTGKYGKQYATDIGWAAKQVNTIYNLYQEMGITNLYLDVPVYKR